MAPAEMMGVVGGGIFGLLTAYKVRRKGEGVPKSKNESIL
jgi:protoporphyrinogen oxidase